MNVIYFFVIFFICPLRIKAEEGTTPPAPAPELEPELTELEKLLKSAAIAINESCDEYDRVEALSRDYVNLTNILQNNTVKATSKSVRNAPQQFTFIKYRDDTPKESCKKKTMRLYQENMRTWETFDLTREDIDANTKIYPILNRIKSLLDRLAGHKNKKINNDLTGTSTTHFMLKATSFLSFASKCKSGELREVEDFGISPLGFYEAKKNVSQLLSEAIYKLEPKLINAYNLLTKAIPKLTEAKKAALRAKENGLKFSIGKVGDLFGTVTAGLDVLGLDHLNPVNRASLKSNALMGALQTVISALKKPCRILSIIIDIICLILLVVDIIMKLVKTIQTQGISAVLPMLINGTANVVGALYDTENQVGNRYSDPPQQEFDHNDPDLGKLNNDLYCS